MHQLATEGAGFGPCGFGVPGKDDNNTKTYVYDIDHRSNQCIAVTKVMDLSTTPVALGISCPVGTGAAVASVTGGAIAGFDMYGQYITETVGVAGTSVACYSSIAFGPADLLWTNTFGLPYKHASNNSPVNITYVAPTGVNGRGSFTWGGAFPAEVAHDYVVDRVNMFGDVRADRPTPLAEVTMVGTINNTGAIAITTTEVADGSSTLLFTFPADQGGSVEAANAAGTVNYQLSSLWMSKYSGNAWTDALIDDLVRGVSKNGTPIKVDLTGSLESAA